ncbi:MAG: AMP-binding protein [Rhodobacterales bacterium]|nr:AMP-binding protein [Rhodobacterales bacterium]
MLAVTVATTILGETALQDKSGADFLPPEAIAAVQRDNWARQRRGLKARSPFLSALWGGRDAPPRLEDLPDLPFCDKALLRQSQADHPPFGAYLGTGRSMVSRLHRTSGTTGQAMNLALSAADAALTAQVGGRAQAAAGLGPGHLVAHCLNYQMWMGGLTDHMTLEATGATVVPFGVGATDLLVRTIQELGVTALSCTPSYPAVLERVIAERFPGLKPRDLGLKLGLFGGEAGLDDPAFRARLEDTWGFAVRNANYGVTDVMCNFAGQCDQQTDLHFVGADVLYPELIDPDTAESRPWAEGTTGELVLTHLKKDCQPLVRFRTGDIITLTALGPCACGRTAPRLRVVGRADDMVTVRGLNVFPTAVAAVLTALPELSGEYRIVLPDHPPYDLLPLQAELAAGREPAPALARAIEESIKTHLRVTARVTLLPHGALPRTEGKTRRVVKESEVS